MSKFKQSVVILLCAALLGTVLFFTGRTLKGDEVRDQNMNKFVNLFHHELMLTNHLLSSVDSWDDSILSSDIIQNPMQQLYTHLANLESLYQHGYSMIEQDGPHSLYGGSDSFRLIRFAIGTGVIHNDVHLNDHFLADSLLSDKEIAFLKALNEDLQGIQLTLEKDDKSGAKSGLSIEAFNSTTRDFLDKYSISNLPQLQLAN